MPFEKIKIIDSLATVIEGKDNISYNELFEELADFYKKHLTLNCIWDFTSCNLSLLTKEDIHKFIDKDVEFSSLRHTGKTAYIAKDNITYGICRMMQLLAENKKNDISVNVFRSKAKALRWINAK